MYFGDFSSKDDVLQQFGVDQFNGTIIYAAYDIDGYEGSAEVVFVDDGKFWFVQASHCSCYGLAEEGWVPEETTPEVLLQMLKRRIGAESTYLTELLETAQASGDDLSVWASLLS